MVFWSVLCSMLRSLAQRSDAGSPSSTVVILSTPGTSWPSHFRASRISTLLVRRLPREPVVTFRANIGNTATGIAFVYQPVGPAGTVQSSALLHLSISLSPNIPLTFIVVIRLILHARNTCTALGITGISGLRKGIVTVFVWSSALYAVSSLLGLGPWGVRNCSVDISLLILSEVQVHTSPWPQSSDRLSDLTPDWIGHCSTAHHPTGRQWECVNE